MLTFLHHRQESQCSQQRDIANSTDIEQTIRIVSSRVDAEACSIGRSIAHRHQDIAFGLRLVKLFVVQTNTEPGTAMVTKEELLECGAVVKPSAAHEGDLFHLLCCHGDVGIQPHTEPIGKVPPIDNTGIGINELPCECTFDGSGKIVGELERVPGIVIARASSDNAQWHTPTTSQDAIDHFMNGTISTDDDDGTILLSSTPGKFFRFSLFGCFDILCVLTFRTTTHDCTMVGHVATTGSRVEDHKGITRGRRCLHGFAWLLPCVRGIFTDCIIFSLVGQLTIEYPLTREAPDPPKRRKRARSRRRLRLPFQTKGVGLVFQPATVCSKQSMTCWASWGC